MVINKPNSTINLRPFYDTIVLGNNLSGLMVSSLLSKKRKNVLLVGENRAYLDDEGVLFEYLVCPPGVLSLKSPMAWLFKELGVPPLKIRDLRIDGPPIRIVKPGLRLDFYVKGERFLEYFERFVPDDDLELLKALYDVVNKKGNPPGGPLWRDMAIGTSGRSFSRRLDKRLKSLLGEEGYAKVLFKEGGLHPILELVLKTFPRVYSYRNSDEFPIFDLIAGLEGLSEASFYFTGHQGLIIDLIRSYLLRYNGEICTQLTPKELAVEKRRISGVTFHEKKEPILCKNVVNCTHYEHVLKLLPSNIIMRGYRRKLDHVQRGFLIIPLFYKIPTPYLPDGIGTYLIYTDMDDPWHSDANFFTMSIFHEEEKEMSSISINTFHPLNDSVPVEAKVRQASRRIKGLLEVLFPFSGEYIEPCFIEECIHFSRDAEYNNNFIFELSDKKWWDIRGVPLHTPIKNLYSCGRESFPSFGVEGEVISARMVVREILSS